MKEKLERLKRELFILEMKDHWDDADFSYADELNRQIKELEDEEKNN